ncbi:MAG: hypothetical protein QM765_21050 [Myxococcales bacterium]
MIPITILITTFRTTTGLNHREHHMARMRRVAAEHQRVDGVLSRAFPGAMYGSPDAFRAAVGAPPFTVTLTRVSPRLADDDNVVGGLKNVRDRVATWLGTGDGPKAPVRWLYQQEQGPFAVRIRIEGGPGSSLFGDTCPRSVLGAAS